MAKIIYKGQELSSTISEYTNLAGKPFINGTELLSGDNSLRDLNIIWNGTKVLYEKILTPNPNTIYVIQLEIKLPIVIDGTVKQVKAGSGLDLNTYGIMNHETQTVPSGSSKGGNNKKLLSMTWNDTGHITNCTEVDLPVFVGSSATASGEAGVVPPPSIGTMSNVLFADGTWKPVATFGTDAPSGGNDGDIYFQYAP